MSTGIRKLFDELRGIEVAVVHPPGPDCDVLVDQLKRIGCRVSEMWPCPAALPPETAAVFMLISAEQSGGSPWSAADSSAVLIALVDYENPTVLKGLLEANAHVVISKPFRPTGVLSTMILARSVHGYEQRLLNKVGKLEETLRSRRVIERAVKLLAERPPGHQQARVHRRGRFDDHQRQRCAQRHGSHQPLNLNGVAC